MLDPMRGAYCVKASARHSQLRESARNRVHGLCLKRNSHSNTDVPASHNKPRSRLKYKNGVTFIHVSSKESYRLVLHSLAASCRSSTRPSYARSRSLALHAHVSVRVRGWQLTCMGGEQATEPMDPARTCGGAFAQTGTWIDELQLHGVASSDVKPWPQAFAPLTRHYGLSLSG
jgi:hypothetical protein